MEQNEKKLIKAELRLEFQVMFNEQDKRITRILDNQEVMQEQQKEFMNFMKKKEKRPWIDKLIWVILGALASKGVPFILDKFNN